MKISPELLERIKEDYDQIGELSWPYIVRKFKIHPALAQEVIDQIKPNNKFKLKIAYRKLAHKLITQMFSMS